MITMTEIARLTHVSQPTVSRVLNGSRTVAPEIRERVLACAREHDYQLNALARGLNGGRTHLLGVILTDISNSFFADVAKQIETEARKLGYSILLFNSDYNVQSEQEYLDVVRRYRVDGVLAVPIRETSGNWQEYIKKLDVPVVAVTRPAQGLDSIYVDHVEAGGLVAEYLVQRGYDRFLFIGKSYDRKYIGFQRTLSALGRQEQVSNTPYADDAHLREDLRACLSVDGLRLAVFAGNDIYGLRVLSALRELGISVPREAGVIGFDDTSMGRYLNPSLSSVTQPVSLMAREAVSRLVYRMDHPDDPQIWDRPLHAVLVQREST